MFVLVVLYAVSIAGVWAWMRLASEDSWAAALFLYGPRWLVAVPLAVLVPAAIVWHRRLLWLLAATMLMIAGPIVGFQPHFIGQDTPADLRILTCNLEVQSYDIGELGSLIERERPDIVALQECKIAPPPIIWPEGWHFVHEDELLVASRYPIERKEIAMRPSVPTKPVAMRCIVQMPQREVQFIVLHIISLRTGFEAVLNRQTGVDLSRLPELRAVIRLQAEESEAMRAFIDGFAGPKIVAGDFNLPVESGVYRQSWMGFSNAFSTAGLGFGFSKITEEDGWTYGTRIDHLLYTPPWRCVRAWLGANVGSDHRPLVADFVVE